MLSRAASSPTTTLQDSGWGQRQPGRAPNYFPNSFSGADHNRKWAQHVDTLTGDVARHDSSNDDNFSQVSSVCLCTC